MAVVADVPMPSRISRRTFIARTAGAGVSAAAGATAAHVTSVPLAGQGAPAQPSGTVVLLNGRIHTLDADDTVASVAVISNGRIMAVGDSPPMDLPPGAETIDLRGRTVIPGLVETHLHGLDTADRVGHHVLEVESAGSVRGVQEALAAHARTAPDEQWVTAIGSALPSLWDERRFPTLRELDEAVPDRPVLLYQGFNGPAATNSLGKRFFDAADMAPPLHPEYVPVNTSADGAIAASGRVAGGPSMSALFLLRRRQTFDERTTNALRTMAYSNALGLTTWLDKSTIYSLEALNPRQGAAAVDPYRVYEPWNALHNEGRMTIRVQFDFTCFAERDGNAMLRAYLRNQLPFFGDDMLRTGGIGEWPAPAAEVEQTLAAQRLVAEARWRCDNDAGDGASLQRVVEQLEAVNDELDISPLRWNVNLLGSGVDWVTPDRLDRLHAMGCSIQLAANGWVGSSGADARVGPAFRTIAAHPISKSLFSNATHISPLNPWLHLHYVVTGLDASGRQVNPGEQLTREDALRLRSRDSAWFLRMEDRIGTIEAGKHADLAVLDRDYFSIPDGDIRRVRSVLTIVGGAIVHELPGVRDN